MLANTGILSRMVLKSRASIVPVIIKLVTVLSSVGVRAENNPPAETFNVLETCALSINVMLNPTISKSIRFISFSFTESKEFSKALIFNYIIVIKLPKITCAFYRVKT